jgi:hypothetical protein
LGFDPLSFSPFAKVEMKKRGAKNFESQSIGGEAEKFGGEKFGFVRRNQDRGREEKDGWVAGPLRA